MAEIRNAVYSSVQRILRNRLQLMEDADTPDAYLGTVSGLAGVFPGAQVTTYTYKPLVGHDLEAGLQRPDRLVRLRRGRPSCERKR